MKNRLYSLLAILFSVFLTIQAQENVMVIQKSDNTVLELNVNDVKDVTFRAKYNSLVLSSDALSIMVGYGGVIHIMSGSGDYEAVSANADVVTAIIELPEESNPRVAISALKEGSAKVTVTDKKSGEKKELSVTVTATAPEIDTTVKYVDLGLKSGTLWATCNLGADAPEKYGVYLSWGELVEKNSYSPSNYTFASPGNQKDLTDANDAAVMTLGDKWRMPTVDELEELLLCSWSWESYKDVFGVRITGSNGNSIFLPAAAFKDDLMSNISVGTYGSYWGRTHANTVQGQGTLLPCGSELVFGIVDYKTDFHSSGFYYEMGPTGFCYCGRSIRPVYGEPAKPQVEGNDYTVYIANSNYDTGGSSGWEGTQLTVDEVAGNAEHFSKDYDTYQEITGLPAGRYTVGVQGFYRKGSYTEDYEYYKNGDTEHNNALLYATSSVGSYSTPLVAASTGAVANSLGGRPATVGDNLKIPDDMDAAGAWFTAGYYHNYLDVEVGDDGILRIGIKKSTTINTDWSIIDNWTLIKR